MNNRFTALSLFISKISYDLIFYCRSANIREILTGTMCIFGSVKLVELFISKKHLLPNLRIKFEYSDNIKVTEKENLEENDGDITEVCQDVDTLIDNAKKLIQINTK